MVIIFDNSEKYFSDVKPMNSGLTNTSSVSDVKPMNNDSNVGGGVIIIPVSLDSVPNDLNSGSKNTHTQNTIKNTHTRDLFEQVKKNMNDKVYSRTKIGDGFMRIDRL